MARFNARAYDHTTGQYVRTVCTATHEDPVQAMATARFNAWCKFANGAWAPGWDAAHSNDTDSADFVVVKAWAAHWDIRVEQVA